MLAPIKSLLKIEWHLRKSQLFILYFWLLANIGWFGIYYWTTNKFPSTMSTMGFEYFLLWSCISIQWMSSLLVSQNLRDPKFNLVRTSTCPTMLKLSGIYIYQNIFGLILCMISMSVIVVSDILQETAFLSSYSILYSMIILMYFWLISPVFSLNLIWSNYASHFKSKIIRFVSFMGWSIACLIALRYLFVLGYQLQGSIFPVIKYENYFNMDSYLQRGMLDKVIPAPTFSFEPIIFGIIITLVFYSIASVLFKTRKV